MNAIGSFYFDQNNNSHRGWASMGYPSWKVRPPPGSNVLLLHFISINMRCLRHLFSIDYSSTNLKGLYIYRYSHNVEWVRPQRGRMFNLLNVHFYKPTNPPGLKIFRKNLTIFDQPTK